MNKAQLINEVAKVVCVKKEAAAAGQTALQAAMSDSLDRFARWWDKYATVEVSGSELAARQLGVSDELDYQKAARLRELLRDLENCIVNGRAAGALVEDGGAQQIEIAGESLLHLGVRVEGHQKGHVLAGAEDVIEEIEGRLLLELEPRVDAVGGIEQETDAERQIGFAAEELDLLGDVVVEDFENRV